MFGHTSIRVAGQSERLPPERLVARVAALGGMAGAGTAHATPEGFIANYRHLRDALGAGNVGLGTDVDGFEELPKPSETCDVNADVTGSNDFYARFLAESGLTTKSSTGNRTWDYKLDCAVSHYGLMPEFLFDVKTFHGGEDINADLMTSALHFIEMWRRLEAASVRLSAGH